MTTLTAEQRAGIEKIREWYEDAADGLAGPFRLFGPAGTGKTTMAKSIPDALGTTAHFMTFTGKAAHVLQRKGVPGAKTIHSSIYYPVGNEDAKRELRALRDEVADLEKTEHELAALKHEEARLALVTGLGWATVMEFAGALDEGRERIADLEASAKRMSWEWNESAFMETNPGLLILDEVSMVGHKLAEDIQRYGIPVLVLGDPAQLPPVDGGGYYTNAKPDYLLETIHRQALESPVLELATRVRLSQGAGLGLVDTDTRPASISEAMEHDQVIVWSNKRRWAMIDVIRRQQGRQAGIPSEGDRVMCLANNKDLAVFNGAQFTVLAATPTPLGPTLRLLDDDGHERTIPTFADGFQGLELEKQAKGSAAGIRGGRMLGTFSQAITCHKSQGSEWGTVYVVNELPAMMSMTARREGPAKASEQGRQWLYTAVTRAADRVTITNPNRQR